MILYAIIAQIRSTTCSADFCRGCSSSVDRGLGLPQSPKDRSHRRTDRREAVGALWEAKWELLIPVVALVALFSGLATPVEAAALTALYAFIVETFVYRD